MQHRSIRSHLTIKEAYNKSIHHFRECTNVKKALIRQIIASVDSHLEELRDNTTYTVNVSVSEILNYLFQNFADDSSKEVVKEEEK